MCSPCTWHMREKGPISSEDFIGEKPQNFNDLHKHMENPVISLFTQTGFLSWVFKGIFLLIQDGFPVTSSEHPLLIRSKIR